MTICAAFAYRAAHVAWTDDERAWVLQQLETYTRGRLDALAAGTQTMDADLKRDIAWYVEFACNDVCVVPPPSLLILLQLALDLPKKPRSERKNPFMYRRVVDHVARNPGAQPGEIKRAIGYDQFQQIKTWLHGPDFSRHVAEHQRVLGIEPKEICERVVKKVSLTK